MKVFHSTKIFLCKMSLYYIKAGSKSLLEKYVLRSIDILQSREKPNWTFLAPKKSNRIQNSGTRLNLIILQPYCPQLEQNIIKFKLEGGKLFTSSANMEIIFQK